jgi:allene oxide cyclase
MDRRGRGRRSGVRLHRTGDGRDRVELVARGEWQCSWTNKLADGQITVEGPFYDTRDSRLAIIGGTGIYRDAHGTMLLHARPDGYDFVFSID